MPALVLFSQRPRVGKTAVAVGLAQRLRQDKRSAALIRVGAPDDESAAADARCFAALGLAAGNTSQPVSPEEAAGLVKGTGWVMNIGTCLRPSVAWVLGTRLSPITCGGMC